MKRTMQGLMLLALIAVPVAFASACGGGGQSDPQSIADAVVDGFKSEKFTKGYDYLAKWKLNSGEKMAEAKKWRMKEGWERWKDLKKRFEGDEGLDPKEKSQITNGEEKWGGASDAERWAVLQGFYKVYTAEDYEKRLKEGEWYLAGRNVKLDVEGQGEASFTYVNRYNDAIKVDCYREGGVWYFGDADIKMEKKMPEKPKD
ncbi:hypothetical protein PLCT2_01800 [Planctomycetaceae bacterium]|nr:hypothetical protein PLCT2_01800 [Planctomycetaceae bacterium]